MTQIFPPTGDVIQTTVFKQPDFIVDRLISKGLYILAGAPKIGKSWLAPDICYSVSKGLKVLGRKTTKGKFLYYCLEDGYDRIQRRIYSITDELVTDVFFSLVSDNIEDGLDEQIEDFKNRNPDISLVIIDTLQMVRKSTESNYAMDCNQLKVLHQLADRLGIAIILVHHTRKASDIEKFILRTVQILPKLSLSITRFLFVI